MVLYTGAVYAKSGMAVEGTFGRKTLVYEVDWTENAAESPWREPAPARDHGNVLVTAVQEMVHRDRAHGPVVAADGGQWEVGFEDARAHDWDPAALRGTEQTLVVLQPQDHECFCAEANEVESAPWPSACSPIRTSATPA